MYGVFEKTRNVKENLPFSAAKCAQVSSNLTHYFERFHSCLPHEQERLLIFMILSFLLLLLKYKKYIVKFWVLTAAGMNIRTFWNIAPCSVTRLGLQIRPPGAVPHIQASHI
jgi:hypothetical protein